MLYYLCFSEQQKINSGFFLFEAEQKAKKAKQTKKSMTEKCNKLQQKQSETKVNKPHSLSAHSSDESSFTDESIN